MSRVGIGIRPPKKRALGIVDVNVLYHSILRLASPHQVLRRFVRDAGLLMEGTQSIWPDDQG
jgi:hypothetical protein